jgi:two-component system OmpR family sensor kinase
MSAAAHTRLATPRKGIDRNRALLNQLLTLARVQEPGGNKTAPVSLQSVFRWVLEVTDTGPGIPEAERRRVFEAFYQSLGQDKQGSGPGLSIVESIATRLQATLKLSFTDEAAQTGLRLQVIFSN